MNALSKRLTRLTRLKPRGQQRAGTKSKGPCNFLEGGDVERLRENRSHGGLPWVNMALILLLLFYYYYFLFYFFNENIWKTSVTI